MRILASVAVALVPLAAAPAQSSFSSFESPQTHGVDVSADGLRMLAVNTPDARIALFSLFDPARPALLREIPTALEPVSVRFRTRSEAWVVCHLADAVQVVDLDRGIVVDTVEVGDEPSDVVFAGGKAFVTVATERRVVVLDAATRAPVASLDLACDEPRWAAASADGSRVWVASHMSGNDTTVVPAAHAPAQPPPTNGALPPPPRVGLIVDSEDPTWRSVHGVDLPDWDVFEIDVASLRVTARHAGVGTNLFGLAERRSDGSLWVANTDARNLVRFEPELRGHAVDNRVTRIDTGGGVAAMDLNPGVEYVRLPDPPSRAIALAQPTAIAWAPDDSAAFVAAFGTDRIGVLDPEGRVVARIDIGPAAGATVDPRRKRGPRALAHHPTRGVLYVLNRLSNSISVVDTAARREVGELAMPDPTPALVKEGRGFLYDAKLSGNGTMSCATCHVDGGVDGIAWDLGDPAGRLMQVASASGGFVPVHPMKGPMTTQSLRGLPPGAKLHWRGEKAGLGSFNSAFSTLLGGAALQSRDMRDFETFVHSMVHGPNPNQNRDRTYPATPRGASAAEGLALFSTQFGGVYQRRIACTDCHAQPNGTSAAPIEPNVISLPQPFRAAALPTIYRRTGLRPNGQNIRTSGFGLQHDGTHRDVFRHLQEPVFAVLGDGQRRQLQAFLEAFDTGTAPAVGSTRTVDQGNRTRAEIVAMRDLLVAQADLRHCDMIARGVIDGREVGLLWDRVAERFVSDRRAEAPRTLAEIDQLVATGRAVLTLMGVPPGEGRRLALDREGDGVLDGDARALLEYGNGSPGSTAVLRGSSAPTLGNGLFGIVTEDAPPASLGILLLGLARVDRFHAFGIEIVVDLRSAFAFPIRTDARGTGVLGLPVPADPTLVGLRLHSQVIFPQPSAPHPLSSPGLTIEIRG